MVADGVRIWEIFSRKSSLNDLALRAILVPRKLPLWPDGDGVAGTGTTPDDTDAGVDDVLLTTAPGSRIGSEWHNESTNGYRKFILHKQTQGAHTSNAIAGGFCLPCIYSRAFDHFSSILSR